jgi:eukaryotic-like serine/threonine-protein kinase
VPNAERSTRLYELFEAALELDPSRRAAFLDQACGADGAMRTDVQSLLASLADAQTELLLPPIVNPRHTGDFVVGQKVGDYDIEDEIGRGGMGIVYRARRGHWEVAVKVVRYGRLASPDALRRFHLEQQVLAQLDHPGITRLLDAGATKDQVPFLVMELVDGVPLDFYCDRRRLTVAQRIALFVDACRAVAHAHEHRIIHRDLKPGNILVTPTGGVKVLDFGIAKLLGTDGGPEAAVTRVSAMAATPQYASPEQLKGERVTAASDVYALGIVLHELVTGRRPYGPARSPLDAVNTMANGPAPPSAVVLREEPSDADRVAATRSTSTLALAATLAGSVDDVVLRALAFEPQRRYARVMDLVDDLVRRNAS